MIFSNIILIYLTTFFPLLNASNHGSSLCLQASKGCQNKEQTLQQRFLRAFKDFQQWLVNAKITTAKCFDIPQNINEVSTSLQKIQVRVWSINSNNGAENSLVVQWLGLSASTAGDMYGFSPWSGSQSLTNHMAKKENM